MESRQLMFFAKFLIPFVAALIASWYDIRERRIPNQIALALLASGLLTGLGVGGWRGLGLALAGFAVGFSVLLVLHGIGGGGAGDVKFMGGVGAWVGAYHVLWVFVLSALLVGGFAVGAVVTRGISSRRGSGQPGLSPWKTRIPYAVPAAAAILLRMLWLRWINRWE